MMAINNHDCQYKDAPLGISYLMQLMQKLLSLNSLVTFTSGFFGKKFVLHQMQVYYSINFSFGLYYYFRGCNLPMSRSDYYLNL